MKGCRALSDAEIQATLARLEAPRDRALFILGLRTGFRVSELLSLRVEDVFQYGHVSDSVAVARRHMKKRLEGRSVPLHSEAKAAIQALIEAEDLKPYHFLFRSRKGANRAIGRIQAWQVFRKAFQDAELGGKLATHSCRKTFASKVYDRLNGDILKTAAALGHKNIQSTVSYLAFKQEDVSKAILEI